MKRYKILVPNLGGAQFEKPIQDAVKLVGLNPADFVLVGYGTSASLCIDSEVVDDEKIPLAITMLSDHLKALSQR